MKLGIVFNKDNQKAAKIADEAEKFLKNKRVQVADENNLTGSDYILTFGGDGTLIHSASRFADFGIPFIGVNTGNIGFLTGVEEKNWENALEKLNSGKKVFLSRRMTLDIQNRKEKHRAVNEAVIKGVYRVAELKIHVNSEEFVTVAGDGVIVATQTGSTGYSLSSGGSIVDPEIDSLIVTFVNPIGLPIPSVVLSPNDEVEVELLRGDEVSLIIDGQEHEKLNVGQKVKISRGKYDVKFGYFDEHIFLKSLNDKFGLASRSAGYSR